MLPVILVVTAGCSVLQSSPPSLNHSAAYYNYIQPSFEEYMEVTNKWLQENRSFISENKAQELTMNMPFENVPEDTGKAILLVHGLGDSPYSFSDISSSLAQQGFHVQVLLLPGHGSKPEHLMLPMYEDWQKIVDHYANLLKEQYGEVWLGGFSTGANLISIHALKNRDVSGLLLFSPGFQTLTPFFEKLTPLIALFWQGWSADEDNFAKYNSFRLKGAIEYSRSASIFREYISTNTISIPTLIVVSEFDSVIDADSIKDFFEGKFSHPNSQLIWYGSLFESNKSTRVQTYSMAREDLKISTGSHMSPLFSPTNPYYGQSGEKKICANSFSQSDIQACKQGHLTWFSSWGYSENDKIFARLTWNPYFNEMEKSIKQVTQQKK
jgi:esterase/lipase